MKRRDFISKAGVGVVAGVAGASALSAPAIAGGHKEINIEFSDKKVNFLL